MSVTSVLQLTEHFDASAAQLYKAWTDPEQLKAWWRPMDDQLEAVTCTLANDGDLKYTFAKKTFEVNGSYETVEPDKKLVFTWNWNFVDEKLEDEKFRLEISFTDEASGSRLDVRQTEFQVTDIYDAHQQAWKLAIESLRVFLRQSH